MMNKFMKMAIDEARKGICDGHGGPFGAVVVKDGKVIAKGHNKVVLNNDPTCHGEIDAIRKACKKLGTFDLDGCEIYTTGYPCPMCFGAIMWSSIDRIYYGCDLKENEEIGFSDKISSIEWYDGNAKLTIIVKYEWEDERLTRASWSHLTDGTKPSKSYAYSYDAHNNVTKINYFEQFTGKYKYGEATSVTYSFQYEYNDDLIQRCNCTYGSNYNIDWTFKYDSKGNWTEMIVKDYDYTRKVKRDIFYK